MAIKYTVLKELEAYVAAHPEFVDDLARIAAEHGADSPKGRRHTNAEHLVANKAGILFYNARTDPETFHIWVKWEIESWPHLMKVTSDINPDDPLLTDFFQTMKNIADKLGISYNFSGGGRGRN